MADLRPDHGSSPGTPRWVYQSGIIALVLVLLVIVVLLAGGGGHGPGRHTAPPGVIALGVQRPAMPVP